MNNSSGADKRRSTIAPQKARETGRKVRDMTWTVYSSLRESILNGSLPPGGSLSQVQLANKLGVSRGPLREAVRMLQREGLVEAEVNHRGRVSSFSIEDLEALHAMRIVHESLAIRINVPLFTSRDLETLRSHLRKMEGLAGHDLRQWQAVDREFHFGLMTHSGNRLMRTIRALHDHAGPVPMALYQRCAARLVDRGRRARADRGSLREPRSCAGRGGTVPPPGADRPHRADTSRAGARSDNSPRSDSSRHRRRSGGAARRAACRTHPPQVRALEGLPDVRSVRLQADRVTSG